MKKNSRSVAGQASKDKLKQNEQLTVGIDLGDRSSCYSIQNADGEEIESGKMATTAEALSKHFRGEPRLRIVIEAGTHSNWVRTHLEKQGHEVIVANPREIPGITRSPNKSDPKDAGKLALYGRVDPRILHPIQHRSLQAQHDLAVLRSRHALVGARTKLINAARGLAKSLGHRLGKCGSEQFAQRAGQELSAELEPSLRPLLRALESLNQQIHELDGTLQRMARDKYPESARLDQVWGVGVQTALAYVLTLEEPERFAKSRMAGSFIGLQPRRSQSGGRDPQLGISKAGNGHLRWLLVECAQRILSRRAPDSELRQWGLKLCERGGKNAKKRAIVAVARKLSVLLHKLWVSGEAYDPWYGRGQQSAVAA